MGQEAISPLVKEFLVESFENINTIQAGMTKLEKEPGNKDLLNEIYRAIHTIKGGAGFVKFKKLETLSHSLENLLDLVRSEKIDLNSEIVDVLLASTDGVSSYLSQVEQTGEEGEEEFDEIRRNLTKWIESVNENLTANIAKDSHLDLRAEGSNSVSVITEHQVNSPQSMAATAQSLSDDELAKKVEQVRKDLEAQSKLNNSVGVAKAPESNLIKLDSKKAAKKESSESQAQSQLVDSVVRVNVNLLDKIMNIVGELVLTRNQILQFANMNENNELQKLSNQLNIITTELQSDVMTTRMQPIGNVLSRFERIVRDMARDLGKKISLQIEGKSTELDKTLLEAIKDPLTHMIRNSVDHGIETPEDRRAKGKSETGTLFINAYHESGQVTIEIKDDGNGISTSKVAEKAIAKGLISAERLENMTEKEIMNLIFLPGFSTAAQVTNISGRGVGMDVVRNNIEKIGGKVEVQSVEGEGSIFKLKIPLTLAIIPALIVHSSSESFAIPQLNLVELVRLEESRNEFIENINGSEFFRLRGDLIPILRLNNVLDLKAREENLDSVQDQEIVEEENTSTNIVVLNSDGRVYGLIVDEILDTVEIVVKPLSSQLKNINFYAGATIMGDGKVALILDVVGLANHFELRTDAEGDSQYDETQAHSSERQEFLLFDIGKPEPYCVPLSLVNRLEEFKPEEVEFTGEQAVVRYRNQAMPLMFVAESLGFKNAIRSRNDIHEMVSVFVVNIRNKFFGFVVDEILDISTSNEAISSDVIDREGLLGTVWLNEKTISVVDVYNFINLSNFGSVKVSSENGVMHENAKTVLVVEDSPLFRKMAVNVLQEGGYNVVTAEDGRKALSILKDTRVDMILSDIEMPHMNGYQLAEHLRSTEEFKNIPMVAITTRFSAEDKKKGKQVGFNHYLEKFKKEEIMSVMKNLTAA